MGESKKRLCERIQPSATFGILQPSNTITFEALAFTYNNLFSYNVIVTDSSAHIANSITNTIIVNPELYPLVVPSNYLLDYGQYTTINGLSNGGSPPYTYNIVIYNATTGQILFNSLVSGVQSVSNTAIFHLTSAYAGNALAADVWVKDSATTVEIFNTTQTSGDAQLLLSQGPTTPTLTASNTPTVAAGSYETFTASESTGTLPLGYAFRVYNSITNVLIASSSQATYVPTPISGFSDAYDVAFSPSGTYAYIPNSGGSNVLIFNPATNTITGAINLGLSNPQGVAFSPSGTYAYITNSGSSNVVIVSTATNSVVGAITSGVFSSPEGVAFSPDGSYAYIANEGGSNVVIVSTASNSVVSEITYGVDGPQGVAFSPSGTYAYLTNDNYPQNVVIINTATNSVTGQVSASLYYPFDVKFVPHPEPMHTSQTATKAAEAQVLMRLI